MVSVQYNPSFDIQKRREQWLQLIKENPGANRSQLKEKGKGLHTWIYRYDWDWYDKVTPKAALGKEKAGTIDWEKRDEECLRLVSEAVEIILQREGKPIRVTPSSIRNTLGFGSWFHNEKLVRTQRYLKEVKEDIDDFRVRKIKWAINEMLSKGHIVSPYKIQLYAGFDGSNKKVRKLILEILGTNNHI
ncbi:TnsD family Tn7-like transposition protein [Ornithinibacillus contaminans]|uniref:TnsD family Tn7-like transposition protein n=1 Tax=Ornithinibacillus contaminans TaxID=694055 RepID=UPI0022A917B4|nr:TnsD family Tn7-like transposition protein [Ornithinibacillus contaminans]